MTPAISPSGSAHRSAHCSVLLIDDERIVLDLIAERLARQADMSLAFTQDGSQAVARCIGCDATVVLVDLRMPGADGFDVIGLLRADAATQDIPIILLSSEEDPDVKARVFAAGANDYLVKWPDIRELEARLRYHSAAYLARRERDAAFASLRQREEELRLSQAALQQAQKMEAIGRLTGGVAHDFNNVLQIVSGNLHLLKLVGGLNEAGMQRADAALRGVERGARLATHLLAFARRQPLQSTVVDLAQVVSEIDDMLRRVLGPRARVVTSAQPGLWNTVVDSNQLHNVLLNLAINARDAMGDGGTLAIRACNLPAHSPQLAGIGDGDYVMIEVADDGIGMTQDVLRRAFEPFYTTKPAGQGTGLGLSMAYGFVKQSGGEITLDSTPGVGTTARIYLRRSDGDAARPEPEALPALAGGVETILVVDDERDVCEATCELLSSLGYAVHSATSADEAADMLRGGMHIDLLLTDVIMPGRMDSVGLSELVHRQLPGAQILFTSGYAEGVLAHDGKVPQHINMLQKPYNAEKLAASIRQLLGRRAVQQHDTRAA